METLAEARVDLAAVRANVATLGEHAPGAQLLAAVKADGYGHGMVQVARAALQGGATWLGCAYVEEALALRAAGIGARILAWIVPPGQPLTAAIREGVDLAAGATWLIGDIAASSREAGRPARLHLKADTGLHRGGATAADWPALVDAALAAQAEGLVEVVGVMSHLARADEPGDPSIAAQIGHFRDAVELAEKAGVRPEVRHICNSAGTLSLPEAHFDLVRPGISVYGLSPFVPPELARPEAYRLRPAMTLSAQVAAVKRVPGGSGVSYGHRYVTERETSLALVPVGYADGIPRAATNTADVLLAGRRRRIAGTVCMDQFMLDVGDDDVREGDRVVLFGPGDHGEPTAQDWAAALGTISWEIVTRVGARVPRAYEGSV